MPDHRGSLAKRLRERRRLFAAWTSLGHPSIAEIFAEPPVDFISLDLEHSTISQEQAQRLIAASQAGGVPCLVRAASHNGEQIRRVLDSGADGIILPNVTTRAQVDQLVQWAKYPPAGSRGYGVARAQGYGMRFAGYTATWNARCVLMVQIESMAAVEAIDTLVMNPHVQGVMVGPYDLSGSLNIPGRLTDRRVRQACARVIAACRRRGKACGIQLTDPAPRTVADAFRSGYTFVVLGSDVFILWKWIERMGPLIRRARRSGSSNGA